MISVTEAIEIEGDTISVQELFVSLRKRKSGWLVRRAGQRGGRAEGQIPALKCLSATATAPLIGRAVDRLGRRAFVLVLIAVRVAGAVMLLAPALFVIIAGLTLCAMCGMMCQAVSTGAVTATAQEGRSSAVGLYVTAFYVGGSAGAFLPGLTWHAAGWPGAIAMVLAMLALMALAVTL